MENKKKEALPNPSSIIHCLSPFPLPHSTFRFLFLCHPAPRPPSLLAFCSKVLVMCFVLVGLVSMIPNRAMPSNETEESVVKIFVTKRYPDLSKPWSRQNPKEVSASGVIIEGNRILTNAHVVSYASQIYVQPHQSAEKFSAQVVAVAPGIDLALLELSEDSFFKNHKPLLFYGQFPKVKDTVGVYGYPIGGKDLSVTEGIISRIDFATMFYDVPCLRIQIDASLNPGNSGGPAVMQGKMIGLVCSKIKEAENIGYIIPIEEIEMFLHDLPDGMYHGQPKIHDVGFQTLENKVLRQKLGIDNDTNGLMVSYVRGKDADFPLRPWDIITHIGEYSIDKEGHVRVHGDMRLSAFYLVPRLAQNGAIGISIVRDGRPLKVQLPVAVKSKRLFKFEGHHYPRYFIYGPLVFSAVSYFHVQNIVKRPKAFIYQAFTGSPIVKRLTDFMAFENEELVGIFSPMFSHRMTKGYHTHPVSLGVLSHVNEVPIKNLTHLVETLREIQDEYLVFRFENLRSERLVFRRDEIEAATEEILNDNGIRYQCSEDLRGIWKKNKLTESHK